MNEFVCYECTQRSHHGRMVNGEMVCEECLNKETELDILIKKVCDDLNVKLILEFDLGFKDGGGSSDDTVFLYPCSEIWIKELSFWHECGHILLGRNMNGRTHFFSKLSQEFAAWEYGLSLASKYGRSWNYNSAELQWARKQLASYINGEYDDLKQFYHHKL